MTTFRFEFLGAALFFSVLCFLFVRNVRRGRTMGEIYSRSILVRRVESPINFWITVVTYVMLSLFAGIVAMGCLALAINPDAVFRVLG